MGDWIKVKAADGHELAAYVAKPEGKAAGGLVVVQEVFGVNASIRETADGYAKDGFVAIAPALFDRIERDVELGYGEADMKKAMELYPKLRTETALLDVAAAFAQVKDVGNGAGVIGYCYGGLMAWLSATDGPQAKMQPRCCVGYYAGGIGKVAGHEPSCPVMLHFGADDSHIGKDQVDAVREAHPEVKIFLYEGAGHAFANAARPSHVAAAAKLARERSLIFLKKHIA